METHLGRPLFVIGMLSSVIRPKWLALSCLCSVTLLVLACGEESPQVPSTDGDCPQAPSTGGGTWGPAMTLGSLYRPHDVAVDASGFIYVLERDSYRVQKFDPDGNPVLAWGRRGTPPQGFELVRHISAREERVYVTEWYGFYVNCFGTTGERLHSMKTEREPEGVAAAPDGSVFVTGYYSHKVFKFNSRGEKILVWGGLGDSAGQFNRPRGIAVDAAGFVYVSESGSSRIQKFTSSGNWVTTWQHLTAGDETLRDIAVSPQGDIYVLVRALNMVLRKPHDAEEWLPWNPAASSSLSALYGIEVDGLGRVFLADDQQAQIPVFSSGGELLLSVGKERSTPGRLESPRGVVVGCSGMVYVSDSFMNRIQVFNRQGQYIRGWGQFGKGFGEFDSPEDLAVDNDGNVFVLDRGNFRIQKFSITGDFLTAWGGQGAADHEFKSLRGLAVLKDTVFVADSIDGSVKAFDLGGTFRYSWPMAPHSDGTAFDGPFDVAVDEETSVYVTVGISGDRFPRDPTLQRYRGGILQDSRPIPNAMSKLRIVDGFIYILTSDGAYLTQIKPDGTVGWIKGGVGSGEFNLASPSDLDAGGSEFIYVANTGNHRVERFEIP